MGVMILIRWLAFLAIGLELHACGAGNKQNNSGNSPKGNSRETDSLSRAAMAGSSSFEARGTEPFWYLQLTDEGLFLKTPEDSIRISKVENIEAIGSAESRYSARGNQGYVELLVKRETCANAMSGEESPYKVLMEYRINTKRGQHRVEGCGSYVANIRLQGKWRLHRINKGTLDSAAFSRGLPELQIDVSEHSFRGFAGCNQFGGQLRPAQAGVEFTAIRATKMACPNLEAEQQFLKALESVKNYSIRGKALLLHSSDGIVLEFRK